MTNPEINPDGSFLNGLISEVTLKCGHLANQATMCPQGWPD